MCIIYILSISLADVIGQTKPGQQYWLSIGQMVDGSKQTLASHTPSLHVRYHLIRNVPELTIAGGDCE